METTIDLPTGEKINAETGEVITNPPAIRDDLTVAKSRRADDLPQHGTIFAVIAALQLWGLNKVEIAQAIRKPFEFVEAVIANEAYRLFRSELIDGVLEAEVEDVRQIFIQNSAKAARGLTAMLDSVVPEVKLTATKEVLDRAGFRPADIVEHRHRIENDLRIVYVGDKKDEIAADFVEIDHGE